VGGSGPKGPDFAAGPVESGRGPMTIRGVGGISVTGPTQLCEVWRNVVLADFLHLAAIGKTEVRPYLYRIKRH
jgi:hypothetical protein